MNWLREVPIRQKLALIIIAASFLALLVASFAVVVLEATTSQPRMLRDITSLGELYGMTLPAPLQFNDAKAATENLQTLAPRSEIGSACVYTTAGDVFASYSRSGGEPVMCPPVIRNASHIFEDRRLLFSMPLVSSGEGVGYLYLQADLPPFYSRMPQYGIMFAVVLLSLFVVSILLSGALKSNISRPILALAETAQHIGEKKDYQVRAEAGGNDEIGTLTNAFNQMLDTISKNEMALNQSLEHEHAARLEAAELYAETQKALHLRDEFISIASHELRTPLTPLKAQLKLVRRLIERIEQEDSGQASELAAAFDSSDRQIERLIRLVDDMLDVSRITSGRMVLNLETVDLNMLAQEVAERYRIEFLKAGSALEYHGGEAKLEGEWDRLRIEQVIVNLMMNALKYGAGKPISFSVALKGNNALLVVRDQGIGIPIEDQERIFERFERAVSSMSFGGLGLGLYITRQIVQAHHGRIYVSSATGKGAAFTVEIPRVQPVPDHGEATKV